MRLNTTLACLLILAVVLSTIPVSMGALQTKNVEGCTTKYVIFRDDDVAPNAKFDELKAVNQVHIDKNIPVTLGIIPHVRSAPGNQLLSDRQFLNYMRSIASNRLFEFAQHGYTHKTDALGGYYVPSEFYGLPYAIQYNTIKRGRDDIKQAFGVTPVTFLPPFDKGDDNTLRAAKALGFTDYCTAFRDFNMNEGSRDGIKVDSVSLMLTNESLRSAESKTEQFLNEPHTIDTFVVLYHPADFSGPNGVVNTNKVKLLSDYVDYLKGKKDVLFTKLDRSWTVAGGDTGNPASDTGSMQQGAIVLPNGASIDVSGLGNLVGGLNGSTVFLLAGAILALSVGSYLIAFRKRGR